MNPKLVKEFEEKGLHFVGHDVDGERMEIMELAGVYSILYTSKCNFTIVISIRSPSNVSLARCKCTLSLRKLHCLCCSSVTGSAHRYNVTSLSDGLSTSS